MPPTFGPSLEAGDDGLHGGIAEGYTYIELSLEKDGVGRSANREMESLGGEAHSPPEKASDWSEGGAMAVPKC